MKKKKQKKDFKKIMLKILMVLLVIDIIFIPLCIFAEVKSKVGICIFILFPLLLAILIVLLSRNCVSSYNKKKRSIEEKLSNR